MGSVIMRERYEPRLPDAWWMAVLIAYLVNHSLNWGGILIGAFLVIVISGLTWP